jgi:hypothetical protein
MPGARFISCDDSSCRRQVAPPPVVTGHRSAPGTAEEDDAGRAWYRWMLGHHVSFGVWRLICQCLSEMAERENSKSAVYRATAFAAELFDVYSALLFYSGDCTPQVYAAAIRPRMVSCHPAFSGVWSRDYALVRALLDPRRPTGGSGARLYPAVKFNRLVHISVAKRLVPDGNSLLRDSGHVGSPTTDDEHDLFDTFFRTYRGEICRHEFAGQLITRTTAILTDLAAHPIAARYDRDELNRFQVGSSSYVERLYAITGELLTKGDAP